VWDERDPRNRDRGRDHRRGPAHGQPTWLRTVSLAAVALATGNVVGGFVVTDRMLEMFAEEEGTGGDADRNEPDRWITSRTWSRSSASSSRCGSCRIRRGRHGNWIGAVGMAFASSPPSSP
jgi:hypothetical protein